MPTTTTNRRIKVTADDIRQHVLATYLLPARRSGQATFQVRIGDIMRDLPGITGVSAPCSALRSERRFQRPNAVVLVADEGPPSGLGYTTTLTFEFQAIAQETKPGEPAPVVASALDLVLGMYGVAGDAYVGQGGGAAVLDKVREGWT